MRRRGKKKKQTEREREREREREKVSCVKLARTVGKARTGVHECNYTTSDQILPLKEAKVEGKGNNERGNVTAIYRKLGESRGVTYQSK